MKIAFITDLHLDVSAEFPFGIDTQKNLQRILNACKKMKPDLLIIGGDVCYRAPEKEIYNWFLDALKGFPAPYECIAGNHDNSEWLAEALQKGSWLQNGEFYFAKKIEQQLLVFLDSSKGEISGEQLKWLSRQLFQEKGKAIIFMHHPPLPVGAPYMDNKYGFRGGDKFMELLHQYQTPIQIFTGHYHIERTFTTDNVSVFITPSCFFQLNQYQDDFKVDHHRIAYRIINIEKNGISTSVHYLAGSRS